MSRKTTHRTYANWTHAQLLEELDRAGIPRSTLGDKLQERGDKTGRWCIVEVLVTYKANRASS